MAKIVLITGGARSGKSEYALQRALLLPGPHIFLATCPVIDPEMDDRIRRHKTDRINSEWKTIEEELQVAEAIQSLVPGSVCLLDCLTLWVNNLMYRAESSKEIFRDDEMQEKCEEFIQTARQYQGTLICVSNEVGMGIVPEHASARLYRDLVGRCNRILAAAADEVVLVSCGLPLFFKGQAE